MNTSRTRSILLASILVASAAGAGGVSAQSAPEAGEAPPVELTVVNHNWADMRIYVLRSGRPHRLGHVSSFRSETFELPAYIAAAEPELKLIAVPMGGSQSVISEGVLINPGDALEWRLEGNLALSGTLIG